MAAGGGSPASFPWCGLCGFLAALSPPTLSEKYRVVPGVSEAK